MPNHTKYFVGALTALLVVAPATAQQYRPQAPAFGRYHDWRELAGLPALAE